MPNSQKPIETTLHWATFADETEPGNISATKIPFNVTCILALPARLAAIRDHPSWIRVTLPRVRPAITLRVAAICVDTRYNTTPHLYVFEKHYHDENELYIQISEHYKTLGTYIYFQRYDTAAQQLTIPVHVKTMSAYFETPGHGSSKSDVEGIMRQLDCPLQS